MTAPELPLGAPVAPPSASAPDGRVLEGAYARLERLSPADHGAALRAAAEAQPPGRFAYMPYGPWEDFDGWLAGCARGTDPLFHAVIPAGGQASGMATFMRTDTMHATIEIGHIWLAESMARSPASTDALALMIAHAFDDLGMRRLEWKCNALNAPSRRAAERLGFTFEGVFRQHMVVKGRNRDTAWFSILDSEWPRLKAGFAAWLDPSNFEGGRQKRRLEECR